MPQQPYQLDRRPLSARELAPSRRAADWLARRGVSPDAISLVGMGAGLAAGAALAATSLPGWGPMCFLAAALLVQIRLLANMLDGMVAVRRGIASPRGELFNEVPDRVSDAAIFIGAGYSAGCVPELGYLAACVALFVAYVRAQGKAVGGPQEFCGPMAKQHRMLVLTVAAIGCSVLPAGWWPAGGVPNLMTVALAVVIAGGVVTAVRRLRRVARVLGGQGQ